MTTVVAQLYADLSPEACVARLYHHIDKHTLFGPKPFSKKNVIGRVNEKTIRLYRRRWYSNGFQTELTGNLRPKGMGTQLDVSVGMNKYAIWFMKFWYVILSAVAIWKFAILVYAAASSQSVALLDIIVNLVVPVMLLFGGYIAQRLGVYLAKGDDKYLLDFLKETLPARQVG